MVWNSNVYRGAAAAAYTVICISVSNHTVYSCHKCFKDGKYSVSSLLQAGKGMRYRALLLFFTAFSSWSFIIFHLFVSLFYGWVQFGFRLSNFFFFSFFNGIVAPGSQPLREMRAGQPDQRRSVMRRGSGRWIRHVIDRRPQLISPCHSTPAVRH